MGRATTIFFGPVPWGRGEGSKGQVSFNFNNKVNFKIFFKHGHVAYQIDGIMLQGRDGRAGGQKL